MKHVLALLVAGAVLSGVCAYAAIARPAAQDRPLPAAAVAVQASRDSGAR